MIGEGVTIGEHVVIHAGTVVGDGLRDPGRRGARQVAEARALLDGLAGGARRRWSIGAGAVICCQAIVFAGARLGDGVIVGDQAFVRERVTIGRGVGRSAAARRVENDTTIGARVKIQTQVYITAYIDDRGRRLRRARA